MSPGWYAPSATSTRSAPPLMSPWQSGTCVAVHAYSPRMPPCRRQTRQDAVGADFVGEADGRHRAPRRPSGQGRHGQPGHLQEGFAAGYEPHETAGGVLVEVLRAVFEQSRERGIGVTSVVGAFSRLADHGLSTNAVIAAALASGALS